jgi:hypothetical protein
VVSIVATLRDSVRTDLAMTNKAVLATVTAAAATASLLLVPGAGAEAKRGCVSHHEAYHTKVGPRLVHVQRRIGAHPFLIHRKALRQTRYYEMCDSLGESFYVRYRYVDRRWRVVTAGFSSALP